MPTEDAYSSGHLVLSHFGTCMCSNVETTLSWTCLVSGLLNFEHPSVLLFCLFQSSMMDGTKDKTYFRREKYQVYAIKHLCIYKAVIVSLAEISNHMKRKVITVLHPSILCETLIPEEISVEDYEYSIVVPKSMFHVVAADITERHKQDCASLLGSGLFDSDAFIDEVIGIKGDTWSDFCLQYFKYACKYGKVGLIRRMLPTLTKTSSGREAIFPGLKEACIKGDDCIVHHVFKKASACVLTDEVIRLLGYL